MSEEKSYIPSLTLDPNAATAAAVAETQFTLKGAYDIITRQPNNEYCN